MFLTNTGDVYTWAHPFCDGPVPIPTNTDIPSVPTYIPCLRGKGIVGIACGGTVVHSNAFYLACTDTGAVYSWGDGNHGKLGRGDTGTTKSPTIVDKLQVSSNLDLITFHNQGCLLLRAVKADG